MNTYDFSRSFLKWTSTKHNHSPRLRVDAACTLSGPEGTREYFLTTMCISETMYADRDLIHLPASEFAVIYCPLGEYVFFKYYADDAATVVESHRVGETMTTADGKGAPITEMSVAMAQHRNVRRLETFDDVRQAILGNRTINARTEYVGEDGKTQVTMNYPVNVCNVAHGRDRWQVDAGAVLLPDFSAAGRLAVEKMRTGYIVFNAADWAEVTIRNPRPQGRYAGHSHFSESRRIRATNHLYEPFAL